MYEIIGLEHAESFLIFHIFSGCANIGWSQGKSKERCAKLLFKDDSEAFAAFKIVGAETDMPLQ